VMMMMMVMVMMMMMMVMVMVMPDLYCLERVVLDVKDNKAVAQALPCFFLAYDLHTATKHHYDYKGFEVLTFVSEGDLFIGAQLENNTMMSSSVMLYGLQRHRLRSGGSNICFAASG
jgi:hypothetical protein